MISIGPTNLEALSRADVRVLCGIPGALLDADGAVDAGSVACIKRFAAYLRGGLQWSHAIARLLANGEAVPAISLAASAPRGDLNEDLVSRLDEAWDELAAEFRQRVQGIQSRLAEIPIEAQDATREAVVLRDKASQLALARTRPASAAGAEQLRLQLEQLTELEEHAQWVIDFADQEKQTTLEQLRNLAARVWSRLSVAVVGGSRKPSAHETALFLALPKLVLAGEASTLRDMAETANLEDVQLAESWLTQPTTTPRQRMGLRFHRHTSGPFGFDLSTLSKTLIADTPSSAQVLSQLDDCIDAVNAARDIPRARERGFHLVALGKSARGDGRELLLAAGLLYLGEAELEDDRSNHGKRVLLDALAMLSTRQQNTVSDLTEFAVDALAIAWAWPALQGEGETIRAWLLHPERLYGTAIVANRLALLARGWADEPLSEAASELILARWSEQIADDVTLLRHLADASLRGTSLTRRPVLAMERLARILRPAKPPQELLSTLAQIGTAIQSAMVGEDGAHAALKGLATRVFEQLTRLQSQGGTAAPIDEVVERLPRALEGLSSRSIVLSSEPSLSVRTLAPEYIGGSEPTQACLPVAISNAETAGPARNVVAFLRLTRSPGHPTANSEQRDLGELGPGEEREIRFEISVPKQPSDTPLTEWKYRIEVDANGQRSTHPLTTRVRPDLGYRSDPYKAGEPLREGELFVGRERQLHELRSALLGDSPKRALLVHGIRRVGKTSLLHRLFADREIQRVYKTVFWDVEDRPANDTSAKFLTDFALKIRGALPERDRQRLQFSRADLKADPFEAFSAFIDSVESLQPKPRILVEIDEFDTVVSRATSGTADLGPELLGAIRKTLMSSTFLHIVFCGLPRLLNSNYDSRLFGLMHAVPVHAINQKEADQVIDAGSQVFKVTASARRLLHRLSGRQPFLLQAMCSFLFHAMQNAHRTLATMGDVMDMVDDRMSDHEYTRDYQNLIGDQDVDLFRALGFAHKAAPRREFVSTTEVVQALRALGVEQSRDHVFQRLSQLAGHGDGEDQARPLLARSPNNRDQFQLIIGLLQTALTEERY